MFATRGTKMWALGLLMLFAPGIAAPASAQSIWLDQDIDRAIYLEILKPSLTEKYLGTGINSTFATAALYLSARFRLPGTVTLRAELPFINAGITDGQNSYSENQFGNPLVGVEIGVPAFPVSGEFGIRFPIVDEEHFFSSDIGAGTDFDRFEAFLPKSWTFTGAANLRYKGPTELLLHFRTGPSLFVSTESDVDPELFADYGAQAGYQRQNLTVLAGITGRAWITEDNVTNRFVDQIGLAASYAFGSFIPGVHFRAPLDKNLDDVVSSVVGINLGYRLP